MDLRKRRPALRKLARLLLMGCLKSRRQVRRPELDHEQSHWRSTMTADQKLARVLNKRRLLGLPGDMLFSSPLFLLLLLMFIMIF
jgi:hypothetical protein